LVPIALKRGADVAQFPVHETKLTTHALLKFHPRSFQPLQRTTNKSSGSSNPL
jgi:hypothetical protein